MITLTLNKDEELALWDILSHMREYHKTMPVSTQMIQDRLDVALEAVEIAKEQEYVVHFSVPVRVRAIQSQSHREARNHQ